MAIQMVDLKAQYTQIQNELEEAVLSVMRSGGYIKGPVVECFEKNLGDYVGAKYCIACANGTDALQIALMALGLEPGDEVITADFTYIATAEVVALLGLKLVLADVNPETFTLDAASVKKVITPKTKAIIPVHLYGQCADMEALLSVTKEHNLFIIEDTAQAIGAEYTFSDGSKKKAGAIGTIGTTSFYPSKNLSCMGDGGAIFTNDESLATKIKMIANHGQSKLYHHDLVGVNSRLDAIQAAVLDVKLKYLNTYSSNRNKAADRYDVLLKEVSQITLPARAKNSTHVFHQYTIKLKDRETRDKLSAFLKEKDIPSMIYYPLPLHEQKAFTDAVYKEEHSVHSVKLSGEVLSLPIHPDLTLEQQEYITNQIKTFFA